MSVTPRNLMSLSEKAEATLRERILSGELAPGDRLPGERQLAEELGISRTALRDALAVLEANGLVETQVGLGRLVSSSTSPVRSAEVVANWLQLHRGELADLNEVRVLLEPAAMRRTPADRLPTIVETARAHLAAQRQAIGAGDFARAGDLDTAFHLALIAESENLPLRVLTQELIAQGGTAARLVYGATEVHKRSIAQHAAILAALTAGDQDRAQVLLAEHHANASKYAFPEVFTGDHASKGRDSRK